MYNVHDCLETYQSQYSVIYLEEKRNTSNRLKVYRIWVVIDEYDQSMPLKDIKHCPFCGKDLYKELELART